MTSASAEAVLNLENIARDIYERPDRASALARDAHVEYLLGGLRTLPTAFTSLDASRAWVVYWCVHGLALLGVDLRERDEALASDVVRFLRRCRSRRGERACFGFGGGPGQMPHIATLRRARATPCPPSPMTRSLKTLARRSTSLRRRRRRSNARSSRFSTPTARR
mmetsp:Transcript_4619/g.17643  ORF Transcript_4619/g.17643 Transcript_4619/m.17643 type:complete len:166 (+) Transcript_4619:24-521(+)